MYNLRITLCLTALLLFQQSVKARVLKTDEPDSVYLFSYATTKNSNKNGLHFAWSRNKSDWNRIGNEFSFLKSDYGRWGSQKKMFSPYLLRNPDGSWQCIWSVNETDNTFARATSRDLINWKPQSYPQITGGSTVLEPVLAYDAVNKNYAIRYAAADQKYYQLTSSDFKTYSNAAVISAAEYIDPSITLLLGDAKVRGQIYRVSWSVVHQLIKAYELKQYQKQFSNEAAAQDKERFAGLKAIQATITVQPEKTKAISNLLTGVFFEDINYAADGGLYAELVQNRDFEYALSDREGRDKKWNSTHSWTIKGDQLAFSIDSVAPIHLNNPHYAVLNVKQAGGWLENAGFDGIVLSKGEKYDFSISAKQLDGKVNRLVVSLTNKNGQPVAQNTIDIPSGGWKNVKATLVAKADVSDAVLQIKPVGTGKLALDMISLFPQKTFAARKNGLRSDLAQTIAAIQPKFVRFPGGCVAHGDGIDNIYRWKNTIGPLESRVPQRNLWGYHQTAGLGYFEYFQFCEDIGAAPLPVLAAGVPCQNSAVGGAGQQGGIPLSEMGAYIQDILDLVEWANGNVNTKWGKKRAEAGHPKPFNLKYIGIGNEDLISDVFEERFAMIFEAIKKKYPEITVIGTVGPNAEGSDYEEGWDFATKLKVPMVDEHYYQNTGWFINNQDYYDRYDRSKSKVYLGEYAAFLPERPSNIETALSEALYMTTLERNGDVVSMASYAPMLAKEGHTQWNPNLIYFNNTEVKPTVGYEVQKLYGVNAGDKYLPATIEMSNNQDAVKKRIAYSLVMDSKSKDLILKIVNLLPVAVTSKVDLNGIAIKADKAVKTVLKGDPVDKNARPKVSDFAVSELANLELPAYSFTVIRIKTK